MAHTRQQSKGFSVIEVMVAVSIISMSVLGIFSLLVYNQKAYLSTKNQFIAAMLSQEGAELVRNVRDSNWLDGLAFNDGIPAAFRIDTQSGIKESITQVASINEPAAKLLQLDGVYRHDSGTPTAFARLITAENIYEPPIDAAVDGLKITSLVQWTERGTPRQRQTVVLLYDWRQ